MTNHSQVETPKCVSDASQSREEEPNKENNAQNLNSKEETPSLENKSELIKAQEMRSYE